MFDIISFVREKILRRPKMKVIAGEELSEKQTTKMGYFLLICMFLAIISTAQWSLSIIKNIPDRPTPVSSCVGNMLAFFDETTDAYGSSYDAYSYDYSYGYDYNYNTCNLVSTNPEYDLSREYNALLSAYTEWIEFSKNLTTLESQISDIEYKIENTQRNYDTSLTEDFADSQNPVYDRNVLGQDLQSLNTQRTSLEGEIARTKSSIDVIKSQNRIKAGELKVASDIAQAAYKKSYLLYRLLVAVLSLLFSGLVFWVLYRYYVRYKVQNSPHTVIFSVATFAYGIILLEVLLMFLWDIIPHKLLEILLGWISLFTPLVYLLQFFVPAIIVWVFGYLVYHIQKRLYSSENILKRFVTDKKCPNCGNAVDIAKPYCPLCAHEIHIHCPHCQALTMKGMPSCSNCGKWLHSAK
jgi:rRNA maturation protein Nop10